MLTGLGVLMFCGIKSTYRTIATAHSLREEFSGNLPPLTEPIPLPTLRRILEELAIWLPPAMRPENAARWTNRITNPR